MKFVKQLKYSAVPVVAILGSLLIEGTIKVETYLIIAVITGLVIFALKRFTKKPADFQASSDSK